MASPVFDNSGARPLSVPGYGLPINSFPGKPKWGDPGTRFRYGADDFKPERMTVREVAMLQVMNEVTEKQDWEKKVFNEEIVTKWRDEALQHPDMSEAAFDWILRELREKAEFSVENKFTTTFENASSCVKSDKLVPEELQQEIKDTVQPLLNLPNPDWHPNSNEQVRNLVHPSLFPLVYGKSRVINSGAVGLADCIEFVGNGEVVPVPENVWSEADHRHTYRNDSQLWSMKFQWLPCEVKFDGAGGSDVKITSYINNLHPVKYPSVYAAIEKLIALSIKPWNEVLICGDYGRHPLRIKTFGVEILEDEMPDWAEQLRAPEEVTAEQREKVRNFLQRPDGPHYDPASPDYDHAIPDNLDELDEFSGDQLWDAVYAKVSRLREFVHPEPGKGQTYEEWKEGITKPVIQSYHDVEPFKHEFYTVNLAKDFRERGLQVIVKIAGVELTPEKPKYSGGNWHLEGMINEHIVATSLYYFDVDNVTDSSIRFRQEATLPDMDLEYEQSDHAPLEMVFGCGMSQEPAVQEFGQLKTVDGRFIAFPNTLQHRVQSFELADKTKPGHRRFIALWLVDPHLRVMSTANVPPQQHEWWAAEAQKKSGIPMPAEVMEMIMSNTEDWPMGLEEAKSLRLELMEERTTFGDNVNSRMDQYFLCEH